MQLAIRLPERRQVGHRQQALAAVQQWQARAHEVRYLQLVEQALEVASAAAWDVQPFAALTVGDMQIAMGMPLQLDTAVAGQRQRGLGLAPAQRPSDRLQPVATQPPDPAVTAHKVTVCQLPHGSGVDCSVAQICPAGPVTGVRQPGSRG
ncbi:hypothetical protein D3C76_1213010 [compost metagenome]